MQVAGLPFSVSDPVEARNGGLRLLREVPEALAEITKFGHVVVGMTATADYQLVAHEPIRNLAELKGKKVGTFGRIAPKAIQAAGSDPGEHHGRRDVRGSPAQDHRRAHPVFRGGAAVQDLRGWPST